MLIHDDTVISQLDIDLENKSTQVPMKFVFPFLASYCLLGSFSTFHIYRNIFATCLEKSHENNVINHKKRKGNRKRERRERERERERESTTTVCRKMIACHKKQKSDNMTK